MSYLFRSAQLFCTGDNNETCYMLAHMSTWGHKQVKPEEIELVRRDYSANGGWETFLAYEDPRQDILVGLLRLRKVCGAAKSRQAELQGRCSIVRELHVYGTAVAVSARDATKQQHQVAPRPPPRPPAGLVLFPVGCVLCCHRVMLAAAL